MPKAYCRSGLSGVQFTDFDVVEETCQATLRLAHHREAMTKDKTRHAATQQAIQTTARFREGHTPDWFAGLGLGSEVRGDAAADQRHHQEQHDQ